MSSAPIATKSVTGCFNRRSDAEAAVTALEDAGFKQSQISLAIRPEYGFGEVDSAYSAGHKAGEKTAGMWGKVVNFFEGKSAGESSTAPSRTSQGLDDADVDHVHGDYDYNYDEFQGSLTNLNVPEHQTRYFGHHFNQGEEGALVTVTAPGREIDAESILERHNADIGREAANFKYPTEARDSANPPKQQRVQLLGEILRVHKDRVQRGEVILHKEVVTENQTIQVPVTREELVITRKAVDGDQAAAGSIGKDNEIHIPLSEEKVRVEKHNVIREEVSVGKREVTGSETVSDNVRHEELRVDEKDVKRS